MTTYQDYQNGDITPMQALRALVMDLGEIESEIEPLTAARERVRNQIASIVAEIGDTSIKGYGRLLITQPARIARYEVKELDRLCHAFEHDGLAHIAVQIRACRIETMRSGSLRIEREKQRAPKE